MKHRTFAAGWFALLLLLLTGCDRFPQDTRHTLDDALRRDTLRVGVIEQPPWAGWSSAGQPEGVEITLLQGFADELGVHVTWYKGSAAEQFEALERYELDAVVGGLAKTNAWGRHVSFSLPYYTSRTVVGVPPSASALRDVEGASITVHPLSGLQHLLEDRGARVVVRRDLRTTGQPVVAEEWEVEAIGFEPTDIRLRKAQHVMAVPPGESAMLMRLESYLLEHADDAHVTSLLQDTVQP